MATRRTISGSFATLRLLARFEPRRLPPPSSLAVRAESSGSSFATPPFAVFVLLPPNRKSFRGNWTPRARAACMEIPLLPERIAIPPGTSSGLGAVFRRPSSPPALYPHRHIAGGSPFLHGKVGDRCRVDVHLSRRQVPLARCSCPPLCAGFFACAVFCSA
jgi:hypothetical protein